jgi:HAD superfamily phosphatase (TIGR01668 family)
MYASSVFAVDYERLWARRGVRALVFDIDNTIVPFDTEKPTEEAVRLFRSLAARGFRLCLLSNNGRSRVERFAERLGVDSVHRALKPGPWGARRALARMRASPGHTALIGDQVFTDILCGNMMSFYTVLVRPVSARDEFTVRLKRGAERGVVAAYKKKWRKHRMARELRNYMEIFVDQSIGGILDGIEGVCRCDDCVTDMKALALNILTPKYIATQKGDLYSRVDAMRQQFEVDVVQAVTKAAAVVARYPRHQDN